MTQFLIVYDQLTGKLLEIAEYTDLDARTDAPRGTSSAFERIHQGQEHMFEVVPVGRRIRE